MEDGGWRGCPSILCVSAVNSPSRLPSGITTPTGNRDRVEPVPPKGNKKPRLARAGRGAESKRNQALASTSTIFSDVQLFITEAIPLSHAASEEYISLLPITWPLVALRTKYGSPLTEVRFS